MYEKQKKARLALSLLLAASVSIVSLPLNAAPMVASEESRELLVEGNQRFVSGRFGSKDLSKARRVDLATNGQKPFAVVVSCSDARVPPELIFDQALGDLFVIRVAGNVVDNIEMGSIEYGIEHLHVPLIIVLGHEKCGAVQAAVDGGDFTKNITAIVAKIQPAIQSVQAGTSPHIHGNNIYEAVTEENVDKVVQQLKESHVVQELMVQGQLQVIGAKYVQDSGQVQFLSQAKK